MLLQSFQTLSRCYFSHTAIAPRAIEVRWRLGQETSLASRCSNLRSFKWKYTVLKKVLSTLLGLFTTSPSDSAPGALRSPCPPRYAPDRTFSSQSVADLIATETKQVNLHQAWTLQMFKW